MVADFKRFCCIGLFSGLNLHQLTTIFDRIQAIRVAKSETVLDSTSKQIGLYFVIEGMVRVAYEVDRLDMPVTVLNPGDSFGEISMIEGGIPSARVQAEEDSLLYFLPRQSFFDLVQSDPTLGATLWEALARMLVGRVRRTNDTVRQYFGVNKALCENPKFREFYRLCQFGS